MISRLDECRLDGVDSPSSSIHLRFTGPRADGRSVMGDSDRREVQDRRVGLELGLGVKERLVGTGICIEGE